MTCVTNATCTACRRFGHLRPDLTLPSDQMSAEGTPALRWARQVRAERLAAARAAGDETTTQSWRPSTAPPR